jgi:retron-type reverse transcriptase
MPKRHHDLFAHIANFQALKQAAQRAVKGKRKKPGASSFFANLETELLRLEHQLTSRKYRPGKYVTIEIRDPKKRVVSAAPFRDRVVHHALCKIIQPIFERGFIDHSYANRKAKGTHKAINAYENYRNKHAHVLRCDIFRYFPAIDHELLKPEFRKRISCQDTLWLMDLIVDGSNKQEPVHVYFENDTLFTPFERKRGLPIGNLTSQFFANLYLNRFDHFVTEVLKAPYIRYVDDFALFHNDPSVLLHWQDEIQLFLEGRRLKLHPRKTEILPTSQSSQFLGFVLLPENYRHLPEDNVRRFRNKLRGMRDQWKEGVISQNDIEQRVQAWIAHAEHGNTWRLRQSIFKGGWFDPSRNLKPEQPRDLRVLRGGSWNNNPENLRSANRNRNNTDNRNNNNGFRVSSTL